MERKDLVIIILLAAILVGVISVLASLYAQNADKKEVEQSLIQKIQDSNFSSNQKQEMIALLQEPVKENKNPTSCTSNSDCPTTWICFVSCSPTGDDLVLGTQGLPGKCTDSSSIDCAVRSYSLGQKCNSDSDCSLGQTCFECHGNVNNQDQPFQKYCLTPGQLAMRQAQCASM